jgi:hypothetical protein
VRAEPAATGSALGALCEGVCDVHSAEPPDQMAIREALKAGRRLEVFSPGPFGDPKDGEVIIEGPHYPKPHRFYPRGIVKDGVLVKIVS